jgi:hypothetical protein
LAVDKKKGDSAGLTKEKGELSKCNANIQKDWKDRFPGKNEIQLEENQK